MSKKINYTDDEIKLIQAISNPEDEIDVDEVARILVQKKGDMAFNKRLQEDLKANYKEDDDDDLTKSSKEMLAYYTFKTRNFDQSVNLLTKLQIAMQQEESGYKLEDFEKITLQEYGRIQDLSSLYKRFETWFVELDVIYHVYENTAESEFEKLFEYMYLADNLLSELPQKALATNQYKSGDLMMYLTSKNNVKKDNHKLLGHEGKLEEIFITKYSHAAPLYVEKNDMVSSTIIKSDIYSKQRTDEADLNEILESDIYSIDPTKLVSKKQIKKLDQIDYGYKRDKEGKILLDNNANPIKQTWEDVMRSRYEELSYALHAGQLGYQLKSIKSEHNSKLASLEEIEEAQKKLEEAFHNEVDFSLESLEKRKSLQNQIQSLENELKTLESEYKAKINLIIKNDHARLNDPKFWINPLEGHGNWFQGNDFRDLSQKMFTGTQEEREMICSEFAGRSIGAVMDQLNRITAIDLEAAELISKEEEIIKNPIPLVHDKKINDRLIFAIKW